MYYKQREAARKLYRFVMSAIQKYRQKAQELSKENDQLREENARLKAGHVIGEHLPAEIDPEVLARTSADLLKELVMLMTRAAWPLAASKIEYALLDAYNQGKTEGSKAA